MVPPAAPPAAGLPAGWSVLGRPGARSQAVRRGKHRDSRRADPVQVETLTPPGWHGLRYAAPPGMDL